MTAHASPPEMSQILSLLRRELWVLTAATTEGRGGLTASWVYSASLDPHHPLLLVSMGIRSHTTQLVEHSCCFAAHLLGREQSTVAWNFCRDSGRNRDKLGQLPHRTAVTGAPILEDCLAWLDCRVVARLVVGDRVLYWGAPEASQCREAGGEPLTDALFFAALTADQKAHLQQALEHDIAQGRPLHEDWRSHLPEVLRPESGGRDRN